MRSDAVGLLNEVREVVAAIPAGQVRTYAGIARAVGTGPRNAGRLVTALDDDVPWWRVVYADGRSATCHGGTAQPPLQREGVPFTGARIRADWMARTR